MVKNKLVSSRQSVRLEPAICQIAKTISHQQRQSRLPNEPTHLGKLWVDCLKRGQLCWILLIGHYTLGWKSEGFLLKKINKYQIQYSSGKTVPKSNDSNMVIHYQTPEKQSRSQNRRYQAQTKRMAHPVALKETGFCKEQV